jgi:hypothetical protein
VTLLQYGAGGLYSKSMGKSEHWEHRSSCSLLNLNGIRGLCIKKLNLTFDMLTDLHLKTAEQFRLVFTLPDYLRDLYNPFGSALDRFHDEPGYRLPMPARYVVDTQGIIRAADVNADYTISSGAFRNSQEAADVNRVID